MNCPRCNAEDTVRHVTNAEVQREPLVDSRQWVCADMDAGQHVAEITDEMRLECIECGDELEPEEVGARGVR